MQDNNKFSIAHISDEMHSTLKQVEEQFEQKLGRQVALVAYEARDRE
ncbi:hypothetical protein [Bacillus sp. 165]|nr:hypothetical protein [Bacillus sp. 165]MBO9128307.1 hypothetical protein [Bacillus sp. 165]